jgi:lambda family phage portal protein
MLDLRRTKARRQDQQVATTGKAEPQAKRANPVMRFLRPDSSGILDAHRPSLRDKAVDVQASWPRVAALTVDALQNQGWIAGAVDQGVVDTVGPTGLSLHATPDIAALGWSEDYGNQWSRDVERRFAAYARNPLEVDARGKQDLAGLTDAFVRMYYAYGEGTARVIVRAREVSRYSTRVQMFGPHRLVQDRSDLQGLYQGVFVDADGLAVGYRIKTQVDGFERTIDLPARDREGRPIIVHIFDGDADQTRGISPMAPALRVTRQSDTLADATLMAALLQTIFAATLKSAAPPKEAFEALLEADEGRGGDPTAPGGIARMMNDMVGFNADFYEGAGGIDLGRHGKVAKLAPGDEFEMHTSNHPGSNYLPFQQNLNREIASCLGVTYEGYSGDYRGATYSSIQMGIASKWPIVTRRRARIAAPFNQAVYEAWLEEEIAKGWTPFPGGYAAFVRDRQAVCQASWRGPAKPVADDLKAARALREKKDTGMFSMATLLGGDTDWRAEQDQIWRESDYATSNSRPDPHAVPSSQPISLENPMLHEEEPDAGTAGGN